MQKSRRTTRARARPLRWDDAQIVAALLRTGSLLAAGKQLGLNASTVSRRLDALERATGGRLFDRSPEGVVPTEVARAMAPYADAMERAAHAMAMSVAGDEADIRGEVRITAPPGYAEHLLAPAIPRLLARHPGLRVLLDASPRVLDLARREADLALRGSRPASGDLVARRLADVVLVPLGAPSYVAPRAPLARPADARWITWGDDLAQIPPAQIIAALAPEEAIVLRTSHFGAQLAAAEAGAGLILGDRNLTRVRNLIEMPLAPELAARLPLGKGELWLVGHRALRDVPRIAATWNFLIDEIASRSREGSPEEGASGEGGDERAVSSGRRRTRG